MVRRALRFLSIEVRSLQAAVYVLALSSLLSSILALGRDRLFANIFGASTTIDLYYAAFRIPDFVFVATGALVSVYMLIPALAGRSKERQQDYIDTVIVGFSLLAVVVSGVAAFAAPSILSKLFPQFVVQGHLGTLTVLTRILLLQPIFLGLSNILAAITQARHRYALYAVSPLLYNASIIVGIVVFYPLWGVTGLAWGVVVGALLHVGIQVPSVMADGFLNRLPRLKEPRALIETAVISVPRALALSMTQLSFLGLTVLAGALIPGSIAVFMFAYNLQAVPLSVIGASYSVAAFPTLASALSKGQHDAFVEHISTAARYVLFWSIPASAFMLVLRAHVVRVVLGSGAFDWNDTRLTAASFALFGLSLAAQGIVLLLVRGYYAAGRTFVPLLVTAGTTMATLTMGFVFVRALDNHVLLASIESFLRISHVPGSVVTMLAIAYAIASILGALVLCLHFEYRFGGFIARIWRTLVEGVIAAGVGSFVTYTVLSYMGPLEFYPTVLSVFTRGFVSGAIGIIVSALAYYVLGSRELQEIVLTIKTRIPKSVKPQPVPISAEDIDRS